MADPIAVAPGVVIPAAALSWRAVRSSGPGGQNVNKVASKVELRVDPARIEGLSEPARRRLAGLARRRMDAEGRIVVTSQRTRDQARNLEDARAKVAALVGHALAAPPARVATRPTARARAARVERKKARAATKRVRGRLRPGDAD